MLLVRFCVHISFQATWVKLKNCIVGAYGKGVFRSYKKLLDSFGTWPYYSLSFSDSECGSLWLLILNSLWFRVCMPGIQVVVKWSHVLICHFFICVDGYTYGGVCMHVLEVDVRGLPQ